MTKQSVVLFFRNMSVFWHTGVLHVSEPKEVQISNDHRHQNHSLQSFFVMIENSFSLSHKKHSHKRRGRDKSQGGVGLQLRLCCDWRTAPVTAGLCSSQAWRGTFPCGAASPPRTSVLLQTEWGSEFNHTDIEPPQESTGTFLTVLLFDQPLVDVADIGEEVAHRCDLKERGHCWKHQSTVSELQVKSCKATLQKVKE